MVLLFCDSLNRVPLNSEREPAFVRPPASSTHTSVTKVLDGHGLVGQLQLSDNGRAIRAISLREKAVTNFEALARSCKRFNRSSKARRTVASHKHAVSKPFHCDCSLLTLHKCHCSFFSLRRRCCCHSHQDAELQRTQEKLEGWPAGHAKLAPAAPSPALDLPGGGSGRSNEGKSTKEASRS